VSLALIVFLIGFRALGEEVVDRSYYCVVVFTHGGFFNTESIEELSASHLSIVSSDVKESGHSVGVRAWGAAPLSIAVSKNQNGQI
jgi:hypothetical protein